MDELQLLINGGLASVALCALYIIYRMQNGQRKEFMAELKANRETLETINHSHEAVLERNTKAWNQAVVILRSMKPRKRN